MRIGKIVSILVCMLVILSSVLIIPNEEKVKAVLGGGGEEENIGLDLDYIWWALKELCNVTYDAYGPSDIPKGRSFGSKGGNYTVNNITIPEMNAMGLEDVHKEQIKHIDEIKDKNYTTIINMTDFQLTVNNASDNPYPYENPVSKEEMFVIAWGIPPKGSDELTSKYDFTDVKIIPRNMTKLIFFAGAYTNYHFNSTDVVK